MNAAIASTTDNASIAVACDDIRELLERCPTFGFLECLEELRSLVDLHLKSLKRASNPIYRRLDRWSLPELRFLIAEYSGFSNASLQMLLEARVRNGWALLSRELDRNIGEELGALCNGVPHLELMRHGYRTELGIETDDVEYSSNTRDFISRAMRCVKTHDNKYLAGVVLAMEATATDEFRVVEAMLRQCRELAGVCLVGDLLTAKYVAGHVVPEAQDSPEDPEMDHFRGMVEAVEEGAIGDLRPLCAGFLSFCVELDRWWGQLAIDATLRGLRAELAASTQGRTEVHDLIARRIRN